MKKLIKWLGIITSVAIIVLNISACGKDSLDRTSWSGYFQNVKIIIRFNNPNFIISTGGHTLAEGTYTISDNIVSMSENVSSENIDHVVFTGILSGNVLMVIMGDETVSFTKRHRIFN